MRAVCVLLVVAAGCGDAFQAPCGNGHLDQFEECDDGNIVSGDRCSTNCLREPTCGDGVIDSGYGENCDDGNTESGDNCNAHCRAETECGDRHIEPGETCEDGNTEPSDGCSPTCMVEYKMTSKVSWRFVSANGGVDQGCPAGFDTVEVTTQPLRDDDTPAHAPVSQQFACADGFEYLRLYQGRYRAWLRVTDATGTPTYGSVLESTIDLHQGQHDMNALFIVDGGYAQFAWQLIDPVTRQALSCADANVFDIGVVASSPTLIRAHFALCTTGHGLTQPLPAGDYTLTLSTLDSLGDELATTSVPITITAPSGLVDVGTIEIPITR